MKIRSAENLTSDGCIALNIFIVKDTETGEYIPSFAFMVPDDDMDIDSEQFEILEYAISLAAMKIDKLVDDLFDDVDEDGEEEEGESDE